jgi:FixJ family two-component response regulator
VKPFDADELLVRARRLLERQVYTNGTEPRRQADLDEAPLTKREVEVLGLLAAGLNQQAIARKLVISPKPFQPTSSESSRSSGCTTERKQWPLPFDWASRSPRPAPSPSR